MDIYRQMIIRILDRSSLASEDKVLVKLKKGIDLNQQELRHLEELLDAMF